MIHEFNDKLKIERGEMPSADAFYRDCMGAEIIKRYDYNNPSEKRFQVNDIDCTVTCDAPGIGPYYLNISEKFRKFDTGDMCIELWSNFEGRVPGWAIEKYTGLEPDLYTYFTPSYIYKVWNGQNFRDMVSDVSSEWDWRTIDQFMREEDFKRRKDRRDNAIYNIKVGGRNATLLRTWSSANGKKWYGVCVCIPWHTLFNDYFIDIIKYDRNYNNLKID